jgi:hypothetical protein
MKRFLLTLFYLLGLFLFISVFITPEYRYRIIIAFALYLVFLFIVLRYTAKNELIFFYRSIFGARFKSLLPGIIIFILIVATSLLMLNIRQLKTTKLDLTSKGAISVSNSSARYLEQLSNNVEIIYVRPVNKDDNRNYFIALMEELKDYSNFISYRTVHPVINTLEYNRLREKASTLVPGNFVVMSGENYLVGERLDEKEVVRSISRVVNGDIVICYAKGNGESELNDFSEKGGGIMYSMLADRGVVLYPVTSDDWDKCPVLFFADPSKDIKEEEVNKLIDYKGTIVLFGGVALSSFKKLLSAKGINVIGRQSTSFKDYALRDYEGGVLVDTFYEHPLLNGLKGGVVTAYGYSVNCKDCRPLAGTSDAVMYLGQEGLLLFAGEKSSTNFFMRFNGNLRLIYNALFFSFAPEAYMAFTDDKSDGLGLFAISPRYLSIILWICVGGVPLLFLLFGIYCFKKSKTVKLK